VDRTAPRSLCSDPSQSARVRCSGTTGVPGTAVGGRADGGEETPENEFQPIPTAWDRAAADRRCHGQRRRRRRLEGPRAPAAVADLAVGPVTGTDGLEEESGRHLPPPWTAPDPGRDPRTNRVRYIKHCSILQRRAPKHHEGGLPTHPTSLTQVVHQ
jgi:hypothetical protein